MLLFVLNETKSASCLETDMDRRIQKSRKAIYHAFIQLLNQKSYDKITVQDIIDLADVGRSTFYAHFESKEILLEAICQDLFQHTFMERQISNHLEALTAHIFQHFKRNQDKIATLLLSQNTYFINGLKEQLSHYLFPRVNAELLASKKSLPKDFLENYVTTTFIETANWWLQSRQNISDQEIAHYFLQLMK